MNELELKYGCNPNQKPSRIYMERRKRSPDQSSDAEVRDILTFWMLLTAGSWYGIEKSNRTSGSNFF